MRQLQSTIQDFKIHKDLQANQNALCSTMLLAEKLHMYIVQTFFLKLVFLKKGKI